MNLVAFQEKVVGFMARIEALFSNQEQIADKLAKAESLIASLQGQITANEGAASASASQITLLETQVRDAAKNVASLTEERDALKAKLADPAGEIALRVAELARSQGLPASKLPAQLPEKAAGKKISRAQFEALPHSERAAFFKAGGLLVD